MNKKNDIVVMTKVSVCLVPFVVYMNEQNESQVNDELLAAPVGAKVMMIGYAFRSLKSSEATDT